MKIGAVVRTMGPQSTRELISECAPPGTRGSTKYEDGSSTMRG
jgi:hypothetical protein